MSQKRHACERRTRSYRGCRLNEDSERGDRRGRKKKEEEEERRTEVNRRCCSREEKERLAVKRKRRSRPARGDRESGEERSEAG